MEERTPKIAIEYLEHYKKIKYGMLPEWVQDMAIKALWQEPCEDATLKDTFCMGCEYKEQDLKTGHWITHKHNGIEYMECSECSTWFLRLYLTRNSYCPNCGAKMVEPQESEEQTHG